MENERILTKKVEGELIVYQFKGRLDNVNSPEVLKEIKQGISEGLKKIIFDFAQLNYMSSAGIRVILIVQKTLDDTKGKLVLCSIPERIAFILKTSHIHTLTIGKDVEEAKAFF